MRSESLQDLYLEQMKDLYAAEEQIIAALPKMARAASSFELEGAFRKHFAQTKTHAKRLEQVFDVLEADVVEEVGDKYCVGMKGLLAEGEELERHEEFEPEVLDVALIALAQRIAHYKMAAYGTARNYARFLGLQRPSELLQRTLDEVKETDLLLDSIAKRIIETHVGEPHG